MKLNNLSRLTALLLALTMFLSSVAWADPVAEGDYTADNYAEMLAAQTGTCAICVMETEFPTTDHNGNTISITCGYEYLKSLGSPMERYNFLKYCDEQLSSGALSALYSVHTQHVEAGAENLWCTCATSWAVFNVPGPENHAETCPWVDGTTIIIPNIPQPPVYGGDPQGNQYTSNEEYDLPMVNDRAIILPEGGRAVIHSNVEAADGYQWQVYDGTQWVGIQGETGADLVVTTAKLATIFDLTGIAEIRYFDTANDIVLASVSVTSQEIAGGEYVDPVAEEEVQTLSLIEKADSTTSYTITVYYYYEGTTTPVYQASVATYPEGTTTPWTITYPVLVGYEAYWEGETAASTSHTLDIVNLSANESYIVSYKPANVGFDVLHYQQNVADDNYTKYETVDMPGYTNASVLDGLSGKDALEKDYPGFYPLAFSVDGVLVAADGSTEVEIYYDRYYYLVKFVLGDGGYGTDPVYDRYGAPITVDEPTRPGYTFAGWDMAIDQNNDGMVDYTDMVDGEYVVDGTVDAAPTAIPLGNQVYVAQWTAQETEYARAYWVQNDDGTKTYIGSEMVAAQSGSIVSGGDTLTVDTYVCGRSEHTHDSTCEKSCTLPDHVHGDGTCVYVCGKQEHDHTSGCYCALDVHEDTEHTRDCYAFTATVSTSSAQVNNPTYVGDNNGFSIYSQRVGWNTYYYVLINDSYYRISNYGYNTSLAYQLTCHYHTSACCNIEAHEHNAGCCDLHTHDEACYSCGAVGHTHGDGCKTDLAKYVQFVDAAQNVTVEGDGSSIVNVNYEYKTYTIRFIYARRNGDGYQLATLTRDGRLNNCQWAGITTLPTFTDPSEKTERSSVVIDGITYYYISLSAKYGADIADIWPSANIGNTGNYEWGSWAAEYGTGYRIKYGDEHANIVGPYPFMSADMILDNPEKLEDGTYLAQNMIAWWGNNQGIEYHAYHNYFELLPGEQEVDGETYLEYEGKTYKLVQTYTFTAAHNGTTRVDPIYFNGYYCVNDTSGTSRDTQANSENYANNVGCDGDICGSDCTYCQNFFYDRNVHKLYFWNHNGYLQEGTGADVVYGDVLTKYGEYVNEEFMAQPENYPEGLEANAYQFAGWYTTAACLDDTEVDWNATMPDADMTFYAKWEPVTHKVNFFLDRTQMENYLDDDDATIGTKYIAEVGVKHNEYVDDTLAAGDAQAQADLAMLANEQVDANYNNGAYTFVGWFYLDDDGKEKMFDPFDMQVKKDMNLYGKWSSNVLVNYTVSYVYKDADDNVITIADRMIGTALAGSTKTFDAKGGTALYEGYQTGYFPVVPSHSITLDIGDPDGTGANTYTFEYIKADVVPYKVYYLAETVADESDSLGIDPVTGYYIIHETKEVPDNTKSAVTETYVPVAGYLPDQYQKSLVLSVDENGDPNTDANVIYFFYTVNEKSTTYEVYHYIEDPTGDVTHEELKWSLYDGVVTNPEIKPGIYDQPETATPLSIPYYVYDNSISKASGTPTAGSTLQLKLYYRETTATINYVPVGPDGVQRDGTGTTYVTGTTDKTSETVKRVTGTAVGATATPATNEYKFVGWYDNAACEGDLISTNEKFVPNKTTEQVWPESTTYFAKFDWNMGSLTITKTGLQAGESAIFKVTATPVGASAAQDYYIVLSGPDGAATASATITNLQANSTYSVDELESWTWSYTEGTPVSDSEWKIVAGDTAHCTVSNAKVNQWLHDENGVINDYSKASGTDVDN